MDQLTAVIKWL